MAKTLRNVYDKFLTYENLMKAHILSRRCFTSTNKRRSYKCFGKNKKIFKKQFTIRIK